MVNDIKCLECGSEVKDYKPEYCCNGIDCGCYGLPIHPPICSDKCWTNLLNKGRDKRDIIGPDKSWGIDKKMSVWH